MQFVSCAYCATCLGAIIYPLYFRRNFERRWAERMTRNSGPKSVGTLGLAFIAPAETVTLKNLSQSEILSRNAGNCSTLEEDASTQAARNRFRRMGDAWRSLALTQDWLDGLISPVPSWTEA